MWLTRYLSLARGQQDADLAGANLLLGKSQTALGRWAAAAGAYYQAMRRGAAGDDRFEAVMGFAQAQVHRENFASALKMVRQLDRDSLAAPQRRSSCCWRGRSFARWACRRRRW